MVRKFREDVRKSVYDTVEAAIKMMGLENYFHFNEHKGEITCLLNGNKFVSLGLYESGGKSGNAKSIVNPTDAIVEEGDECTEDEFEKMDMSLRGSEDLQTIFIFNTHKVSEDHWIFLRWFPARDTFEKVDGSHTYVKSTRKGCIILHTTFLMNPFLTKAALNKFIAQKENAPERYQITGLGLIKIVRQSHLALKAFDRVEHVNEDIVFNPENLIYEIWDFNRMPHHTCGLWQFGGYDQRKNIFYWNCVTEFCLEDHSVKQVQEKVNKYLKYNNYQSNKVSLVCDYYGNTKKDHDINSDITRIKNKLGEGGFKWEDLTIVNPSVLASLDFLNDMLDGLVKISDINPNYGGATIKIQMHPSCKFHIADFEKTKTDVDGSILKVKVTEKFVEDGIQAKRTYQARGHAVDCSRYMVASIFNHEYDTHRTLNNN